MKVIASIHPLRFSMAILALGLGIGGPVFAGPTINSVVVQPIPLGVGQGFTIQVSASSNVVQGVATVDFRPWAPRLLRIILTKQGSFWTGTGTIPADLVPPPGVAATVTVLVFDALRASKSATVMAPVIVGGITATFTAGTGQLVVLGNSLDNTIVVGRDAAGSILVNGGAVPITGGPATVANTVLIKVFGRAGNDQLTINDSAGPLPKAQLFGEDGDDTLTGGNGDDLLDGGPGNNTMLGNGGADILIAGEGDDVLTGGRGNDVCFGGAGNDTFIWNPGDGSDTLEGQGGVDVLRFNGANISEHIELSANGNRLRFHRDVANVTIDADGIEDVVVRALGGADTLTVGDLTGTGITDVQIDLAVSSGSGGDGQADTVIVDGTAGVDVITVAGDATGVSVDGLTANVVVTNGEPGLDAVVIHPLDGTDTVTIGDLVGTGLIDLRVDLAGPTDPNAGDAQSDQVIVEGTDGVDIMAISGGPTNVSVLGLAAAIGIAHGDTALDQLVIEARGGDDVVNASGLAAGAIQLDIDGGEGNDQLTGSAGNDLLIGGNGDDVLTGGRGNDVCFGGAGNDTFIWNPGDGSDTLEGQDGVDVLRFNGANIGEHIELSANGNRLRFTRDVGNVTIDAARIEDVVVRALGGADTLTVGDLTGTAITDVQIDLAVSSGSGGDGQADTVIVDGTAGDDVIVVAGDATGVSVAGLAAAIEISNAEAALDRLVINALSGDDVGSASGLTATAIGLTIDGGAGDDVLIGGAGNDILLGGAGDDVLLGGPGLDILDGGPGNNIIIQD